MLLQRDYSFDAQLAVAESERRQERMEGECHRPRNLKGSTYRRDDEGRWFKLVGSEWVEIEEYRS